jgi:hypothetical protein
MLEEVPRQITAAGVPAQFADQFAAGGGNTLNDLAGVGDLGARILADVPEAFRAQVEPLIPGIVAGIHEAFSIATASTFVLGIVTALLALVVVAVLLPAGRTVRTDEVDAQGVPLSGARAEPVTD